MGDAMMLRTEDLFLGALALIRGGTLRHVELRTTQGRRMAVFCIEGSNMNEVEHEYFCGASSVDIRLLKFQVARLKNMAFDALRSPGDRSSRPAVRNQPNRDSIRDQ